MDNVKTIRITKNRGWRGLAEVVCMDKDRDVITRMVFSFSQPVWEDMLRGSIVLQDSENYYIINFTNLDKLPKPTQQRSVLIKGFESDVNNVYKYSKASWQRDVHDSEDYKCIYNFIKNRNNHTTSDWNYIGIRVVPSI